MLKFGMIIEHGHAWIKKNFADVKIEVLPQV